MNLTVPNFPSFLANPLALVSGRYRLQELLVFSLFCLPILTRIPLLHSPGDYNDRTGADVCQPCIPGFYNPGFQASVCAACQVGYDAPKSGSTACSKCQPGLLILSSPCLNLLFCSGTYQPLTYCNFLLTLLD